MLILWWFIILKIHCVLEILKPHLKQPLLLLFIFWSYKIPTFLVSMLHINFAWVISKCKSYGWKWNLLLFQKVKGIIWIKISSVHEDCRLRTCSEQFMHTICAVRVRSMFWACNFMNWTCNSMNNLLSFCGLVDARISVSEKDLPVLLFICVLQFEVQN